MTFILELTGERHRIERRETDQRVVWGVCGIRRPRRASPPRVADVVLEVRAA